MCISQAFDIIQNEVLIQVCKIFCFLKTHDTIKRHIRQRHAIREKCRQLAQQNLAASKEMRHLQDEIKGLDDRIAERFQQLNASIDWHNKVAGQFSKQTASQRLQVCTLAFMMWLILSLISLLKAML